MNPKERKYLKELPQLFEIHRGMTVEEFESGEFGISWTLSKSVAEFFATKYLRNHSTNHLPKMIHSLKVNKKSVLGYLNSRQEQEIVLYPDFSKVTEKPIIK